jgi:hypothetical protein
MIIEQTIEIRDDRRLVLKLPEETPVGRAKAAVTLVFESMEQSEITALKVIQAEQIKTLLRNDDPAFRRYTNRAQDLREARIAIAFRYGKPHDDQSYAKHAGCLKDSGVFAGDSASIQEEMRREWA